MTDDPEQAAERASALAERCKPIFAHQRPELVGAALCELVALHLAGHFVAGGDANDTAAMRDMLLEAHIAVVRKLVPIMEATHTLDKLKERMQ